MGHVKKYRTIIFDFDGTLVDSRKGVFNSFRYSLSKFGLKIENEIESVKFIGPPLKSVFMDFFSMDNTDASRAVDYFREYYGENGAYESELYTGIESLLSELFENGRMLMIATTKAQYYMDIIVRHLGIDRYFVNMVGSNLDGTLSDKPELIRHALEGYTVQKPGEAVMIGDRKFDILGARETGIDSIGVSYGFGTLEEIREAGPDYVVESVDELREFLLG